MSNCNHKNIQFLERKKISYSTPSNPTKKHSNKKCETLHFSPHTNAHDNVED